MRNNFQYALNIKRRHLHCIVYNVRYKCLKQFISLWNRSVIWFQTERNVSTAEIHQKVNDAAFWHLEFYCNMRIAEPYIPLIFKIWSVLWMATDWPPTAQSRLGVGLFSLVPLPNIVSQLQALRHSWRGERSS